MTATDNALLHQKFFAGFSASRGPGSKPFDFNQADALANSEVVEQTGRAQWVLKF